VLELEERDTDSEAQSARAARRFGKESDRWDRIYSERGSIPVRLWDRYARRNVRQRFVRTFEVAGDLAGRSVLDLGCGSGRYLIEAASRGSSRVVGVDLAPQMLSIAARLAQAFGLEERIELRVADLRTLDLTEQFDLVCANGVFDYIDNAGPVLARIARWTRGLCVASFPDRGALRAQPRRLYWRMRGLRIALYEAAQVERLAQEAGFRAYSIERLGPIHLLSAHIGVAGDSRLARASEVYPHRQ
jgi:SAM-dependent methyltransferase